MVPSVLKRFPTLLAAWAAGFLVLLLLQSGGSPFPAAAWLPSAAYQALLLAAFPAGIGVARMVLPRRIDFGAAGILVGLSLALAGGVFWVSGWIAPVRLADALPSAGTDEPRALTLPVLAEALERAVDEAEGMENLLFGPITSGSDSAEQWIQANRLIFEHDRRYAQSFLLTFLPMLGVFVGALGAVVPLRGLRMGFFWGIGLFLLVSEYFALENGFELVAVRTVGGETPAGLFALIVPGTLFIAFGAAAVVRAVWPGEKNALTA